MIFRKELVDLLRDRKTLIGTFIIPIVVIPLVFFLVGYSFSSVEKDAKVNISIAVSGDRGHEIVQRLQQAPGVVLEQPGDPIRALQDSSIRAVLTIPDNFAIELQDGKTAQLSVSYDSSNQKSTYARSVIEEVIDDYESEVVSQRLQAAGLSTQVIQPIETVAKNVASEEKISGGMLAGIIPLMLVLSLASGGIAAATDLVAGEKERGTMESLISAPIPASAILTAKLLAVMVISGISAVASLISLSIVFNLPMMQGSGGGAITLGFLQPMSLTVLVIVLLLLAAMFAALELILSTLAKSFKESQTYMTGVVLLAMVPSYMMMPLNAMDIPTMYYYLPIFNGVAMCKEVFYGSIDPVHAVIAIATSLVYVGIVIVLASYFFRKESLLTKG